MPDDPHPDDPAGDWLTRALGWATRWIRPLPAPGSASPPSEPARDAQAVFAELLSDHVRPVLREGGFSKRGSTFHRAVGDDLVHVVNFQRSKYSTRQEVVFMVNVSVFSWSIHRILSEVWWMPEVRRWPPESACHVRARIQAITKQSLPLACRVVGDADPGRVAPSVLSALRDHALPYLDGLSTPEALRDAYVQGVGEWGDVLFHPLHLAAIYLTVGPRDALPALLDQVEAEAHASGRTRVIEAIDALRSAHGIGQGDGSPP